MANNSNMTLKINDVEVSQFNFTELDDNNQRSKGQRISYPRYTNPENGSEVPLFIQFPWIDMKSYGIPKLGEYYENDSDRSFVKVPLNQSDPEIKQLSEKFQELDKKFGSDEFKEKMFGAKGASKYEYQPIFRLPQDEEDTKKDSKTKKDYGPKQPYMKLKIDTEYGTNVVKTIVFSSVLKNGKRERTKINDIKTIDDFASHVCWMSRIHPVVRPVKLWAQPTNKKNPTYGVVFKIAKTEVEPPVKMNSNLKQYLESNDFLDSDEVETTSAAQPTQTAQVTQTASTAQPTQVTQTVQAVKVAQVASDDESDGESDNEPMQVKTATTKAPVKKVIESDGDESDEVKTVKKTTAKAPAKTTASKAKKNFASAN